METPVCTLVFYLKCRVITVTLTDTVLTIAPQIKKVCVKAVVFSGITSIIVFYLLFLTQTIFSPLIHFSFFSFTFSCRLSPPSISGSFDPFLVLCDLALLSFLSVFCHPQTPEELDDSDFETEDFDVRSRTSVQTEDDQLIAGQSARVSCKLHHEYPDVF